LAYCLTSIYEHFGLIQNFFGLIRIINCFLNQGFYLSLKMAWTQEELQKLEAAIAQGARVVKYADKEVEYRSLKEMLQIRDEIKKELGLISSSNLRKVGIFDKGL